MTELNVYPFEDDAEVCLKIKGMPYRCTEEEVCEFFKDFKIKEDSIQWGLGADGRKNGFGAVVFENEDEASRAAEALNKQYIGARYVFLETMAYEKYKRFNAG